MDNTDSHIKFDYSDAYVLVKGIISIEAQAGDNPNNGDKVIIVFKNCAPFTIHI